MTLLETLKDALNVLYRELWDVPTPTIHAARLARLDALEPFIDAELGLGDDPEEMKTCKELAGRIKHRLEMTFLHAQPDQDGGAE